MQSVIIGMMGILLTGCADFPTGTFTITRTPVSNTCNAQPMVTQDTADISIDDSGSYDVSINDLSADVQSQTPQRLLFEVSVNATVGNCNYVEVDDYVLVTKNSAFAGSMQATLTDSSGACPTCSMSWTAVGAGVDN